MTPQRNSGQYYIGTTKDLFELMKVSGQTLPKMKIEGNEVNRPEIELWMSNHNLLRLVYKGEDWIITKIV